MTWVRYRPAQAVGLILAETVGATRFQIAVIEERPLRLP